MNPRKAKFLDWLSIAFMVGMALFFLNEWIFYQ